MAESGTKVKSREEAGQAQLVFGVVFDLNGAQVPVSTKDIKDAKAKGVEFTLPDPVRIGSMSDLEAWLQKRFKVQLPSADSLPPPLNEVIGKITTLEMTVSKFHVKIPGTDAEKEDPKRGILYTVALAGDWRGEGIDLIPDVLSIRGVVLGASNE